DQGVVQYDSIDHVLNQPSVISGIIGSDTLTSPDHLITPLGTSKKAGRNQILFKASELLNLGLQYGKITDIGLNIKGISNPLIAYDGYRSA
ncbi:MAG: hypothetical protein N4A46_00745, partial [Schleiferiaceae bacterium]|nr:hypothetical protein [Schleiferiaceae bacterium]